MYVSYISTIKKYKVSTKSILFGHKVLNSSIMHLVTQCSPSLFSLGLVHFNVQVSERVDTGLVGLGAGEKTSIFQ